MESNITKLKIYSNAIDLDDFADYLIQSRILEEPSYQLIWQTKHNKHKENGIFNLLDKKGPTVTDNVLRYLEDTYPNLKSIKEDERKFRISTMRGGLPKLPPCYVRRQSLAQKVKLEIESLTHGKLLIHGMIGYGKSCLVNEVLNNITLRKHFDNNVFWINLGEHHNMDNIIQPLWRLYLMASDNYSQRLTHCPENVDELKHCLSELFLKTDYLENALIILDDVCDPNVLQCFDLNCNTVITTQDRQILCKKEEAAFIEVNTGFTLEETLELFQNALNADKSKLLPSAAEEIHHICKGHPMLIAMIGSYLWDYKQTNYFDKSLWEYIKNMILKGQYRLNEWDEKTKIPTETLDICISKLLTKEQRHYYDDLSIFPQDVNIPPKVLEVLWNKPRVEVGHLMNKFADKSLIVVFYNNNTFIYGIHDLHLNYLKEQMKDTIAEKHRKLISNYDKSTAGDFSKLPDDNYSFQFIGYHLKHAEALDKFSIYFDLRFLEAKVRACGKEDVIKDMDKYKDDITKKDNLLIERLKNYKEFVKQHGANIYYYRDTDIVQYALQERKDSYVFKEAFDMAKNSKHLYFQFQKTVDNFEYPEIIHVQEDITCARFVDSPWHILIGSSKGHIKYFYEQYDKPLSHFEGHSGAITDMQISLEKTHFLSVSKDHKVILWKFAPDSARNSFDLTGTLASPKIKQRQWLDVFAPDGGVTKPKSIFELKDGDDYLISASFSVTFEIKPRIVTGSHEGNVMIWDADGQMLEQTLKRGFEAPFVMYLPEYLMFACDDNIIRFSVNEQSKIKLNLLTQLKIKCSCPFFISQQGIVAVGDDKVVLFRDWEKDQRVKPNLAFQNDRRDGENICSTITDDLKYLVIGTNKNVVMIYDIEEEKIVRRYNINNDGISRFIDTVYDEGHSVHLLLMGADKRTLQMHYIQPKENELCIQNCPKFIPFWKKRRSTSKPLLALFSANNTLQIFQGYVLISESEVMSSQITCTCFSACGNNVIYGLENGEVREYNIKSKSDNLTNLTFDGPISYLQCFGTNNLMSPSTEFRGFGRSESVSSSNDSLLDSTFSETYNGTIVAVSNNIVKICYGNEFLTRQINNPYIFHVSSDFVIVDGSSNIYYLKLSTAEFAILRKPYFDLEVKTAAICNKKRLLCICSKQSRQNILEIVSWNKSITEITQVKSEELRFAPVSLCFSPDGELLAIGMDNGLINVYNVTKNYESTSLQLHKNTVCHLIFSPSVDPILISMADQIAWWNLKPLKSDFKAKGKPKSISILENINENLCQMKIDLWSEMESPSTIPYLLSCVKLRGKPKLISASDDFTTFLVMDDKGKIDILEVMSHDL